MSYSLIPTADYKAACDAIRAKTGKTDLIKSGDMASEIASVPTGGGGASFNIHYGTEAPEDTSKLWVETDTEPTETRVTSDIACESTIETLDTTLPTNTATFSIAAGVVGTKIYLFGGHRTVNSFTGTSTKSYSTINVFDTETNTIETLDTTLPKAAGCIATGVVGTKIYLFGGYSETDHAKLDTINVFDTETNTIETLDTTLPTAAGWIATGVVGTKIYLFGGLFANTLSSAINVFDTETNTIETLDTTLPTAVHSVAAGVIGTKVYLFGGCNSNFNQDNKNSTINVFDTETNTIETLDTALPTAAGYIAAGVVGTKIYLFGGCSNGDIDISTINVFDTKTNTIETLDTALPTAAQYLAAGVVGTKIYLFGGSSTFIRLFALSFTSAANTAAVVPSLTENVFPLMDVVELGVSAVYIGNADGQAEQVNAYLHNGTDWALI